MGRRKEKGGGRGWEGRILRRTVVTQKKEKASYSREGVPRKVQQTPTRGARIITKKKIQKKTASVMQYFE